ncbi:hypothetical protein ACKUEK_25285, partial [Escherichia coli]
PGKQSYAISVTLQDPDKTFQHKQIETVMQKVVTTLQQQPGAELR